MKIVVPLGQSVQKRIWVLNRPEFLWSRVSPSALVDGMMLCFIGWGVRRPSTRIQLEESVWSRDHVCNLSDSNQQFYVPYFWLSDRMAMFLSWLLLTIIWQRTKLWYLCLCFRDKVSLKDSDFWPWPANILYYLVSTASLCRPCSLVECWASLLSKRYNLCCSCLCVPEPMDVLQVSTVHWVYTVFLRQGSSFAVWLFWKKRI
jgi:hypothetical protein